jgi:hypothetical protein
LGGLAGVPEWAAEGHTPQGVYGAGQGGPLPGDVTLPGLADASGASAVQAPPRGVEDRAAVACPAPLTLAADQLPAARNRSTTLCGIRPRGETSILFALAHARTA